MERSFCGLVIAICSLGGLSAAQAPTKQALLMAMSANGKQATGYQWKQRTTVVRNGKPLDPTIEELRFDLTGQLRRTTLLKPEEKKMGPIRARKAADVKESIQGVMQLAVRYVDPRQMAQAIQKGDLWEGEGRLRVEARYLVSPDDQMTLTLDARTYLPTRADFKASYDGDPVAISAYYDQLPNGPSMTTRMTVQMPDEGVAVNVESFDFVRLAGPTVN